MTSLDTLIQLAKAQIDEQRQLLSRLVAHQESIELAIAELELRRRAEEEIVAKESAFALTYGEFLKWAMGQAKELENQRLSAAAAVELARDKLSQMFEEQKRYEIAQENQLAKQEQEEARQERIIMDEIGGENYRRSQKKEK